MQAQPPSGAKFRAHGQAGFSLGEVGLVMGIIGVLAVVATPTLVSYYQAARLRVAAEEVATVVNRGRQLGIRENSGACVRRISSSRLRFHIGTCSGTAWVGEGTDASGHIRVPQGFSLSSTADPVFNHLGAATTTGTFTLTNAQTGATLRVFVNPSGRVRIGP